MAETKAALVTGGSSGIGLSCAKALKAKGWRVFTLSRRDAGPEGFEHIRADVSDPEECRRAVEAVLRCTARLDLLVNCAGFGISGAAEFTPEGEAESQVRVNLFGTANMCKAVIPQMRQQGGGRILNVSSFAALTPIPFQIWYSVSKAGINSFTMALANELRPFGISAAAIMPGDTKTGFTDVRRKCPEGDEVYRGVISRSVAKMEKDERGGMSPDVAGSLIARLAGKKRLAPLYTVGFGYKCLALLFKLLPAALSNRILGKMYAT
ncbi:MAG: SDR family NAD(P)-dependent oxidoreductase [Clostridia bacterium]|nr:SDR family NAD(P)-dependent oxidoreductase [Clostridia bacterium]